MSITWDVFIGFEQHRKLGNRAKALPHGGTVLEHGAKDHTAQPTTRDRTKEFRTASFIERGVRY